VFCSQYFVKTNFKDKRYQKKVWLLPPFSRGGSNAGDKTGFKVAAQNLKALKSLG